MMDLSLVGEKLFLLRPQGLHALLLAAFVFLGIACIAYAWPVRGRRALLAMPAHAAGGVLSILAGDLITLLIGWELLSLSAFFLIAGGKSAGARRAAWRYLVFQIAAAAALFVGLAAQAAGTGSLAVRTLAPPAQPYVLLAVAIKTAAVPLHGWLVDGYPAAPWETAPLLSLYATKVGVYTAARLLDLPLLTAIGVWMALAGVLAALVQTTGRRLLSYHIVSQVGYMLAGIGLGGALGADAGLLHAVHHMVYKALLFMVMGAVMMRTGEDRLDRLGGLAKAMPLTFAAGIIASASIAGLPPFNGFVSKELLKTAAGPGAVRVMLALASMGTGLSFLKFLYQVFLRPHGGYGDRIPRDPPALMQAAMLALACLCIFSGLFPGLVAPHIRHAVYTPSSVTAALLPLAGSLLLWLLLKPRRSLLVMRPSPLLPLRIALRHLAAQARSIALQAHTIPLATCLLWVLAAWMAAVMLLARLGP